MSGRDFRTNVTDSCPLSAFHPVATADLIRIGNAHDGGYIVNRCALARTRLLISGGISNDWTFEEDFLQRVPGARLVAMDGSVSAADFFRRGLGEMGEAVGYAFRLKRWYAFRHLGEARRWFDLSRRFRSFFARKGRRFVKAFLTAGHASNSVTWQALSENDRFVAAAHEPLSVFLKLDIEGSEFEVLPAVIDDFDLINSIVLEFHNLETHWSDFVSTMDLLSKSFAVTHIHGNNWESLVPDSACPRMLEVTLVNRALLPGGLQPSAAQYPVEGLDQPNQAGVPDYPLFR